MCTCYLGIDDGYFDVTLKKIKNKTSKTVLVGVTTCFNKFSDMFIEFITIDGFDATQAALTILTKSLSLYDIDTVFLDGVTYAGFNIIDPRKLYAVLDVSIITVFRHRLDLNKIYLALRKHFADYRYRFEVIENIYSRNIELKLKHIPVVLRIYPLGINILRAKKIVLEQCRIFAEPYPLRIADETASLIGKLITIS